MASKPLIPLSTQVEIVDSEGKPTPQFCRVLQKLAIGTSLAQGTDGTVNIAAIAAKTIMANKTAGSASPTSCTLSEILDFIGAVAQGAILYRGASGWTFLPAGTAGQVLTTGGAGANPSWAAGGGGSSAWDFSPPLAAGFTLQSGDATNLTLTDDTSVGLLVSHGASTGGLVYRTAYKTLTNKTLDWTLVTKFKRTIEQKNYRGVGLYIRDSISGKAIEFDLRNDLGQSIVEIADLVGTGAVVVYNNVLTAGGLWEWQRIRHTGGNYIFEVSPEGKQWAAVATIGDTAYTTNRADRVGILSYMINSGPTLQYSVPYWSLTGPGV